MLIIFCASLNCFSQSNVKVKIHSIEGYGSYSEFARQAATALEKVINSKEFKIRMFELSFIRTNELDHEALYQTIKNAHELQGQGGEDGVIDLRIRTLRVDGDESNWKNNCERSTIGIDGQGDGVSAICPNKLENWYNDKRIDELAGHFAHEYMHILGFNHSNILRGQSWREKTFVYKIGNLVSQMVKEEMERHVSD